MHTVITGGTSHIARALTPFFLKKGDELCLFARRPEALKGVDARVESDFSRLAGLKYDLLINCIGAGTPNLIRENPHLWFSVLERFDNLALESLAQKNQEALLSLARQLFEEVRKTGRIHTGYALPVANVFDYLILIGAIAASPGRLKDIEQMGTDKEKYVAKRKFLEDIFAEMIAAGNELTIPSKEG